MDCPEWGLSTWALLFHKPTTQYSKEMKKKPFFSFFLFINHKFELDEMETYTENHIFIITVFNTAVTLKFNWDQQGCGMTRVKLNRGCPYAKFERVLLKWCPPQKKAKDDGAIQVGNVLIISFKCTSQWWISFTWSYSSAKAKLIRWDHTEKYNFKFQLSNDI